MDCKWLGIVVAPQIGNAPDVILEGSSPLTGRKFKRNYTAKDAKKFGEVRRAILFHYVCIQNAILFQIV